MDEITHFLYEHPPFSQLPLDLVRRIASVVHIEYFAPGVDILVQGGKPASFLYMVRRGSVDMLRSDEQGIQTVESLGEGEFFGYVSLIRSAKPILTVRARRETLAYLIPAATFQQVRRDYPAFAQYFARSLVNRLEHALETRSSGAAPELFQTRLRDVAAGDLSTIDPTASVCEAAYHMRERNVSCLLINLAPNGGIAERSGIITDRDLRNRVLAECLSYDTAVGDVMTTPVVAMPAESLVFEGLLLMLERGIHHLPIVERGRVVGIVTYTDILRRQSNNPLMLPRQLERAEDEGDLRAYTDHVAETVGALFDSGARVSDIGRLVAVAHDALLARLLRDAERALGAPPCPYAFLVLGSEGRFEQTLRTDQDNALIYADDAPPGAAAYFEALAARVVEQLVACGFPRCPGDIMASNPRWRQPLRVWQGYFQEWIGVPDEEALLRAAIFFDYRQVHGALDAEAALRPIIRRARDNRIFLGRLARAALRNSAPLNFFQQLAVQRRGDRRDLLDLKMRGTALVVDMARLFALEAGVASTSTIARLKQAAGQGGLSKSSADELVAAFELLSQLRLRHQLAQLRAGEEPTNFVSVSKLAPLERRELKEALRAVASIQRSVEQAFQTSLIA